MEKIKKILKNKVATKPIGRTLYQLFKNSSLVYNFRFKKNKDDYKYIEWRYFKKFGKKINLDNPKTFNEKNNWRKLYDRKPIYTLMVDKYKLKEVVKSKIGSGEYTVPLIEVWSSPDEIDFQNLPNKFVLKVNHAGGVIVCRDKKKFDIKKAKKELKEMLKFDYFYPSREWPYKNVERKVICEEYMGENLVDFKNYCFNGKVLYTFVWQNKSRVDGRKPEAYFCGAYDKNWEKSEIVIDYPTLENTTIEKPEVYDEMIKISEILSKEIPFVRVDCYIINNKVYVGEMTFFPWGGWMKFKDEKWDKLLGELQVLPEKNI